MHVYLNYSIHNSSTTYHCARLIPIMSALSNKIHLFYTTVEIDDNVLPVHWLTGSSVLTRKGCCRSLLRSSSELVVRTGKIRTWWDDSGRVWPGGRVSLGEVMRSSSNTVPVPGPPYNPYNRLIHVGMLLYNLSSLRVLCSIALAF